MNKKKSNSKEQFTAISNNLSDMIISIKSGDVQKLLSLSKELQHLAYLTDYKIITNEIAKIGIDIENYILEQDRFKKEELEKNLLSLKNNLWEL